MELRFIFVIFMSYPLSLLISSPFHVFLRALSVKKKLQFLEAAAVTRRAVLFLSTVRSVEIYLLL